MEEEGLTNPPAVSDLKTGGFRFTNGFNALDRPFFAGVNAHQKSEADQTEQAWSTGEQVFWSLQDSEVT